MNKENVKAAVKVAFQEKIDGMLEEKTDEVYEEDAEEGMEETDGGDSLSEDSVDVEDEVALEEAMQVVAMKKGFRGNPKDKKKITIRNMGELKKLAKENKYEYFTVTKADGDEIEYHVDHGKLVEM